MDMISDDGYTDGTDDEMGIIDSESNQKIQDYFRQQRIAPHDRSKGHPKANMNFEQVVRQVVAEESENVKQERGTAKNLTRDEIQQIMDFPSSINALKTSLLAALTRLQAIRDTYPQGYALQKWETALIHMINVINNNMVIH